MNMTLEPSGRLYVLRRPVHESRVTLWVRRAVITIAGIYAMFFSWSIYRRIWQVVHIEAQASSTVLPPGATVGYDVLTGGEVRNLIRLELVQGAHHEVLFEERSQLRRIATFDVRLYRSRPTVSITPELLSRFQSGPATLRVTGFGSQKLLRTPGPRVAELQVELAP